MTAYGRNYVSPILKSKSAPAIDRRTCLREPACELAGRYTHRQIAMLGEMNDRRILAIANRDRQALRELAIEYDGIGCPRKAAAIRAEATCLRLPVASATQTGATHRQKAIRQPAEVTA